jgi:BirA family transcriptional regulator, biotin operon repressor / biotin---[acetyl-CoA-carboxylase] ligase
MNIPKEISYLKTVDSTQAVAKADLSGVFWTSSQTNGKGRFDRNWHAEDGHSLAVSIAFSEHKDLPRPQFFGMGVAVAIAEEFNLLLQWPNDLILNGKKVGGVLIDVVERIPVVGIGLNLSNPTFPDDIAHRASSLFLEGRDVIAPADALEKVLRAIASEPVPDSWQSFSARWMERDATEGKAFKIYDGKIGVAKGISANGELIWTDYETEKRVQVAEALWP